MKLWSESFSPKKWFMVSSKWYTFYIIQLSPLFCPRTRRTTTELGTSTNIILPAFHIIDICYLVVSRSNRTRGNRLLIVLFNSLLKLQSPMLRFNRHSLVACGNSFFSPLSHCGVFSFPRTRPPTSVPPICMSACVCVCNRRLHYNIHIVKTYTHIHLL